MSSNFEISRKIRHVRDFIFNATFKGMWLYSPFESLAFDWMQLVSAQIQSVSYNPIKFLQDIENFASHVRCVDGIESDRVETFDDRIQMAMKEVKGGLASNNWDLCQQVVKDNAVVLGQKRKASEKSSIKAKSLSDHWANSGDGVTKLFESAVDAAIKPTIIDIKSQHDTSRVAAIEDSAERISRIFQSLHDYGAQLGYLMSAESIKKEKSADLKGTIRNLSTLPSQKKQLPLSRMTVSDIKCRSSSSANAIPLPSKLSKSKTLHEQPSETSTVTRKLAAPIVVKKAAPVETRSKEFTDSTSPLKRAKLAGHHVLSASWLKVDLSRGPNGPSKNSSSLLGQTMDSTFPLESGQVDSGRSNSEADQESLTIAGTGTGAGTATIEDQTNVIKSKYIGVHALMKVFNQKTRTGSGSSGPATTSAGELDYVARVLLLGRDVNLGMFSTEEAAARAHDRALIRAIGPSNCRTINLNFPVSEYSCEPLSRFMEFDEKLKGQLFATAWTGLKHCDFGFLLIRGAQNQGHASLHMQHQVQKLALLSSALETGTGTGTDASSASSHTQATHSRTNAKVAATVKGGLRVRSGSSTSASAGSSSAAAAPSSSSSSSSSSSNDAIMATAPPSFAFTSVSLKSKIVKEADVQRNKVAPPVFGTLLSVSNVPSINPISQAGSRGSRGWLAAKHEKIPMQRAIYLGPHTVPGRCVLGFFEGSRVIAGATFLQRFPEGIYTGVIACEVTNSYDEQDSALKEMYRELIDRTGRQETVLPQVTGAPIPLAATEETQSSTAVCNSAELDDAVPSSVGAMMDDSNSRGPCLCPCPSTPRSHVDRAITTTLPCTTHTLNLLPATSRTVESIDCEISKGSATIGDDAAFTSRHVSSRSTVLDGPLPSKSSKEVATLLPELVPASVSSGEIDINEEASSLLSAVRSSLSVSALSLVLKSCESPTKIAAFPDASLTSPAAPREVITESLSSAHSCEPKQANSKLHLVGRPLMETRIDDHIQVSSLRECGGIGAEVEPNASRADVMGSNTIPTIAQVSAEPMRQKNTGAVQIMPCPVIQPHSISLRELIFGGLASAVSPIRPVPVPVNLHVDLPTHLPVPVLPSMPHQQHIIKGDQSSHIAELALVSSSPPKLVTLIIATAPTSSLSSSSASITAAQNGDVDKVMNASPTVNDTCEDTCIVGPALLADCSKNNEGQRKEREKEKEEEREVKKKEKEEEREGRKKEKEDEREERRKEKKEKKEKKENQRTSKKCCATETAKELEVSEGILSQKKHKKESKKSSPVICEIVREKRKYTKRNQNVSADIVAQTHAYAHSHAQGQSESEVMDASGEGHPSGDIAEEDSPKESDALTVDDEEENVEEPMEEEEDVDEDETPWTAASLLQLMSYRPVPSAQTESSGAIDQHSNGRSRRSSATNPATNLDYFNLSFEKHRLNEISHYTCFALGEEAKRLRACLRACESAGDKRNEKGFKMYRTTSLMKTDWEGSIEYSSLQADGLSRRAALKKLRSAIVVLLSRGREESEGIDILCPPQIFRGVQAADSSMTETDSLVVPVSVVAPAHTILPNTRYVAADLFATGARFLGLFASPLEAALVREQILDREGYLVKKKKRAVEDRSSTKNLENFNNSQWAMVTDMTALMESFIREQCLM